MKINFRKIAIAASFSAALLFSFASCEFLTSLSGETDSTEEVTSLTISGTKTVAVGKTVTLTATPTPSTASTTITWTSADSSYATVGSSTGKVKGIKAGKVKITATAANGVSKSVYVTVTSSSSSGSSTTETNLITSISDIQHYFAPGWTEDSSATTSGNLSSGITYYLPNSTSDQWQAQLKLATDADLTSGTSYSFSCTVNSTVAMSNVTVKFASDSSSTPSAEWTMYNKGLSLNSGNTSVSFSGSSGMTGNDVWLIFDFGGNEAGTIKVSNIKLTSSSSSSGSGSGTSSDASVDTTSSNAGTSTSSFVASNTSGTYSSYNNLVWSDEFNGSSLDTSIWTYETGNGTDGWGNWEKEYYTAGNNVEVTGGCMHITVKNESYNGYSYTSTRIKTAGKKTFKYGKIVARMKMEQGTGSWTAFWMLGTGSNYSWPYCGEIDIMEHANENTYTNGTLHWNYNGKSTSTTYGHGEYGTLSNSNSAISTLDVTQWHTYELVWNATKISILVDGNQFFTMTIGDSSNGTDCFNEPFYILFNFAAGGQYVGVYSGFTNLPWNMYVDYVRVYQ